MDVPFVDLKTQYQAIASEIDQAIADVIARADFILGEELDRLEAAFAVYCEAAYAVGVDSGTSALELALRAYDIGPGDEVITVANTFFATAAAISYTGARPVLVDMDPATYNLDPARLEAAITPRTRGIIPVHLYGRPADMDPILEIARRHGLIVLEDACQAHGARYKGRRVGSLGDAAAFSFYPGKNLGAYGDGGMVVTADAGLAEKIRLLRNYGQPRKYHHESMGYNRRLDTLQAAILRAKLPHLDDWNARRRAAAEQYRELLADAPVMLPAAPPPDVEHVYHLFVIQVAHRDELQSWLKQHGVHTGIHYPIPIHLQPAYRELGYGPGAFPATEAAAGQLLSLPMFPEITPEQLHHVAQTICEFEPET